MKGFDCMDSKFFSDDKRELFTQILPQLWSKDSDENREMSLTFSKYFKYFSLCGETDNCQKYVHDCHLFFEIKFFNLREDFINERRRDLRKGGRNTKPSDNKRRQDAVPLSQLARPKLKLELFSEQTQSKKRRLQVERVQVSKNADSMENSDFFNAPIASNVVQTISLGEINHLDQANLFYTNNSIEIKEERKGDEGRNKDEEDMSKLESEGSSLGWERFFKECGIGEEASREYGKVMEKEEFDLKDKYSLDEKALDFMKKGHSLKVRNLINRLNSPK